MISEIPLLEKYITIGGYRIRFIEKGEGSPVIFIHGLGASLEWWEFNLEAFSQKFRVVAFDLPGFGLSSKPKIKFSLDFTSEFMFSFLNAFQLSRASLVGNSLGGLVALSTALRKPERIDKLILLDNAGFSPKLSFLLRLGTIFPVGEFAVSIRNRLIVRMFLSRLFYDRAKIPSHLVDCVLRMFDLPETGEACLRVLRSGVNLKGLNEEIWLRIVERASLCPHKTLIVWGANDRITPVSQAYLGKSLIKNARLHIFKKCGHLPHVEWPEKFNRVALSFLES